MTLEPEIDAVLILLPAIVKEFFSAVISTDAFSGSSKFKMILLLASELSTADLSVGACVSAATGILVVAVEIPLSAKAPKVSLILKVLSLAVPIKLTLGL